MVWTTVFTPVWRLANPRNSCNNSNPSYATDQPWDLVFKMLWIKNKSYPYPIWDSGNNFWIWVVTAQIYTQVNIHRAVHLRYVYFFARYKLYPSKLHKLMVGLNGALLLIWFSTLFTQYGKPSSLICAVHHSDLFFTTWNLSANCSCSHSFVQQLFMEHHRDKVPTFRARCFLHNMQ